MRSFWLSLLVVALTPVLVLAQAPKPRKVVLIAGKKSHGPGHHEYEKGLRLVKHCLDNAENLTGLKTELYLDGWPTDPKALDDASTIVAYCDGSDRDLAAHPLLQGDRLDVLAKAMKRGCGFVALHYTVFVPVERGGTQFLDWLGGHFDYETGTAGNKWASKITTATTTTRPMRPEHPISRGLEAFELKEEYYHHIKFRPGDGRLVPILATPIPGVEKEQLVAWAVERADGGRGFGFTGGHFHDNWAVPGFRRMILNAIVWTTGAEVPEGGLRTKMPTEQQVQEVPLGKPAPGTGKKEPPPASIALTAGKFGRALDANASPIQIEGQERFRTTPLSVECWAKLSSEKGYNVLVACDPKTSKNHWELYSYSGSGNLAVYLPGSQPAEIVSTTKVTGNTWHHVGFTNDGKVVKLYVDGQLVKEQAIVPREGGKAVAGPLTIGMAIDGAGGRVGCEGLIDEVRITGGLREIKALPTAAPELDMPTIGLWRFDAENEVVVDPAWTPRPISGDVPWWWKMTDKDWVDPRLRTMDTGPTFAGTFRYTTPGGPALSYKGMSIRLGEKRDAGALFDRGQLRWSAAWTGGYLTHSDRRFGLLNTPTPAGDVMWSTRSGPGWRGPDGHWVTTAEATTALPATWGRFNGHYLHGEQVILSQTILGADVLETVGQETLGGTTFFTRTLEIGPSDRELQTLVCDLPAFTNGINYAVKKLADLYQYNHADGMTLVGASGAGRIKAEGDRIVLTILPGKEVRRIKVLTFRGKPAGVIDQKFLEAVDAAAPPTDLGKLTKGGPARWKETLTTTVEKAADNAPYVIDTLTIPYENPYKALFFLSGVDFLGPNQTAVSAAHGDVWTVTEKGESAHWKRHATGLYHPLGLKVLAGKIVVLERGQLTRLHDLDNDGEADYYENVCNDWHTGAGEHSYDSCLEVDAQGRFYFFKTGDGHLPHGGCLLRVSGDGKTVETFATGFRHPVGMGMSPTGLVTGADQEGNYMPSTRIDAYKQGGFYGDLRTHHRSVAPSTYDPPLVWLPREMDNSAGGQIWVPKGVFGPLSGQMLHLSYGRCAALLVLTQQVGDTMQGGAIDLGWNFLSGSMRGRFGPDKNLYVVGMNGWQTAAKKDGSLQRVRYTGQPIVLPRTLEAVEGGIKLTFSEPLAPASADARLFQGQQWNYRWSGDYGSKRWSVANPNKEAQDPVTIGKATLANEGKTVFVEVPGLGPVMQFQLRYDVTSASGQPARGAMYMTIHRLGKKTQ